MRCKPRCGLLNSDIALAYYVGLPLSPLLEPVLKRIKNILARRDEGGWPTRDSSAQEEDC